MTRQRRKLIYLLGFMGSGKSTVGPMVAEELAWPFIDLDSVIEAGQQLAIREIFERAGEPFFRGLERAALTEVARTEPAVIALGGGTFAQEDNMNFIRESGGTTVWLDCPIDELRARCATMLNRPLFRDPESFELLFSQRVPYYRLADLRVTSSGRDPLEIAREIVRQAHF